MVHTSISNTMIKGPYQPVTKEKKDERVSSGQHQDNQQQPQSPNKQNKYGAWGSIYKSKEHFVDMHIC